MAVDFRELGKKFSNWDRWGADDRIGTLNLITPDRIAGAGKLIRKGKLFDLSIPLGANGPATGAGGRVNPIHLMGITPGDTHILNHFITPKDMVIADDWITMPLQCATQWDGLGHVGYDHCFYNHVPSHTVSTMGGSSVLSIEDIIVKGPTGRGVLLDITAVHGGKNLDIGYEITPADLEVAEKRQNVRVNAGDILLIRTGWIQQFTIAKSAHQFWAGEPGIGLACIEWLYKREVAAIASDNFGVEVVPQGTMSLICHCVLIRDMGMTLGEIFDLDALAADCEQDGVWEFSSGIGLAAAKAFAAEGAIVAVNDIRLEPAQAALAEIEQAGGNGMALPGDVSIQEQVNENAKQVIDRFGRIDVLISNAGIPLFEPAEKYSGWRRSVSINLDGHFFWAQAVANQSMIPNHSGAIVITSSLAGLGALIGDIGYVTTKHGLVGMTKGLAVEWAKYGIRVNCVAPGITDSLMVRENLGANPAAFAARVGRVPLARLGQPEEQAAAMLFLASDDAAYITGHTIPVDGGQMALHSGFSAQFKSIEAD